MACPSSEQTWRVVRADRWLLIISMNKRSLIDAVRQHGVTFLGTFCNSFHAVVVRSRHSEISQTAN
jgi:hypothetical protein